MDKCETCGGGGVLADKGYIPCPVCALPKMKRKLAFHLGLNEAQIDSSFEGWDILNGEAATVAARRELLKIGKATVEELTTGRRFEHLVRNRYNEVGITDGPPGMLYIGGGLGTGKSYFCEATLNAILDGYLGAGFYSYDNYKDAPMVGYMITEAELDGALKVRIQSEAKEGTEHFIRRLSSYGLLIVDDGGVLGYSEFTRGCLWRIFDQRYSRRLPMWFTSNLPLRDYLKLVFGEGLAQRFLDRFNHVGREILLGGASRRQRFHRKER